MNMMHSEACREKDNISEVVSGRGCVEQPWKSSERGGTWVGLCGLGEGATDSMVSIGSHMQSGLTESSLQGLPSSSFSSTFSLIL